MNHHQKTNRKVFFWSYFGGLFLAIILGCFATVIPVLTWVLLIEGVSHIGFLSFLGWRSKSPPFRIYAGERIQTAGYLHTLIGFCVAIMLLSKDNVGIESTETWLAPMGSALITSILGWFCGGEIAYKEDDSLDKAIKKIETAFDNLQTRQEEAFDNLQTRQEEAFKNLQNTIAKMLKSYLIQLAKVFTRQNKNTDEKIENLVIKLQENNESIIERFNQLNSIVKDESDTLQETFGQLNKAIKNESKSVPQSLEQLSSVISKQSQDLRNSFEVLNNVIGNNSSSFSDNLEKLETESKNAVNSMSGTSQSVERFAEELKHILILIEQLEQTIKYIIENTEKTKKED